VLPGSRHADAIHDSLGTKTDAWHLQRRTIQQLFFAHVEVGRDLIRENGAMDRFECVAKGACARSQCGHVGVVETLRGRDYKWMCWLSL
jgi:hypothetical protein